MRDIDFDALAEEHYSSMDPAFDDDYESHDEYDEYSETFNNVEYLIHNCVNKIMEKVQKERKNPLKFAEYFSEDATDIFRQEIEAWKE